MSPTIFSFETPRWPRGLWLALGVCAGCCSLAGCYDAEALVDARRAVAVRARLVEVDLGEYSITLPRPYKEFERAQVNFHAFGQVAHRDLKAAEATLKARAPDLRHRLLLAVRQMDMQEIGDPALEALRKTITEAVNEMLAEKPVQSVGFYSFTFANY